MQIVDINGTQYRVHPNGLVHKLQNTKNGGFGWVVVNKKSHYIEWYRATKAVS